jgi:hypothetical protein
VVLCRMSNYAYFGAYAFWNKAYARTFPTTPDAASAHAPGGRGSKSSPSAAAPPTKVAAIFSGGMAGISYWMSCYPMDAIKARMMSTHTEQTKTIRSTARLIYQQGGCPSITESTPGIVVAGALGAVELCLLTLSVVWVLLLCFLAGKGFFQGFTPCIVRAFPANAAAFLAFEWTMSVLPQ